MHAQHIESHSRWTVEGVLNVKDHLAVHEKLNYTTSFIVSFSNTHRNFHHLTLDCMHLDFLLCLFSSNSVLFTSSVQCSVHQLCGHGVSHGAAGHRQGDQSDTGDQPAAWCDHRPLQSVHTRHHAHRQSEEVSPHVQENSTLPWDDRNVLFFHI